MATRTGPLCLPARAHSCQQSRSHVAARTSLPRVSRYQAPPCTPPGLPLGTPVRESPVHHLPGHTPCNPSQPPPLPSVPGSSGLIYPLSLSPGCPRHELPSGYPVPGSHGIPCPELTRGPPSRATRCSAAPGYAVAPRAGPPPCTPSHDHPCPRPGPPPMISHDQPCSRPVLPPAHPSRAPPCPSSSAPPWDPSRGAPFTPSGATLALIPCSPGPRRTELPRGYVRDTSVPSRPELKCLRSGHHRAPTHELRRVPPPRANRVTPCRAIPWSLVTGTPLATCPAFSDGPHSPYRTCPPSRARL